jgi:hypothetical protein
MFNLKTTAAAVAIALTLASCSSTPESEDNSYRDPFRDAAYQKDKPLHAMSKAEKARYWQNIYKERADIQNDAECIFGTKSIYDRDTFNCEKVEGSPEWKALQKEKSRR